MYHIEEGAASEGRLAHLRPQGCDYPATIQHPGWAGERIGFYAISGAARGQPAGKAADAYASGAAAWVVAEF